MEKIFLSHSSADKDYVKYIADQFGKDRCVYDEMCFERGMKTIDEIFRELEETSIFVVFISDSSLNSDWVKRELNLAEEKLHHDQSKLSQIFPIIIDETITYTDERIPDYLKTGFNSYNLRVIKRNVIAYRKICAQLTNLLLQKKRDFQNKYELFYGRDSEITQFKDAFDSGSPIKCLVVSGIEGIGRRSYITKVLKDTKIIDRYYTPVTIALDELDGIEDLIVKLYEVGFGDGSLVKVASLQTMQDKIDILANALMDIQEYREHVIVYDRVCLVKQDNEIRWWFTKALEQIRPEVTISIAAKHSLGHSYRKKNSAIFGISLLQMTYPQWNGLLRVYSKAIDMEFDTADREYFKDIITGYPPQVIYCADLAKDNDSIDYVKRNSYKIVDFASDSATRILSTAVPDELTEVAYGFLSFLSAYGSVPTNIVEEVLRLNDQYEEVYHILHSLTVCRSVGTNREYVMVNSLFGDYIQRNRIKLPDDIRDLLNRKIKLFNENINDNVFVESEDFEMVRYYLKENLKSQQEIPEKYIYPTLYLKTVYELYNQQKYDSVIDIVKHVKESGVFEQYDLPIQERMQGYFCRALARKGSDEFYTEVGYFSHPNTEQQAKYYIEYNFLQGFQYRISGNYERALEKYLNVLEKSPRHRGTVREIVIVYKGLEDFDSAFDYAQINYENEPENPYQIQPYFEALLKKASLSDLENHHLKEMLKTLDILNRRKPFSIYYELMAQYALYYERDIQKTRAFLNTGEKRFPESTFMIRTAFDCYEVLGDTDNMKRCLRLLKQAENGNNALKISINMRQLYLDAHEGKPEMVVLSKIESINGITDEAKERLRKNISTIYRTKS